VLPLVRARLHLPDRWAPARWRRIVLGPDYDDIGERLVMGRHSYTRPRTPWFPGDPPTKVTIGNYASIAHGVEIIAGGGHPLQRVSLFPFRAAWHLPGAYADGHPTSRGDVEIGSDVWIGRKARILSGVRIGHGAVVAAYSVVARDVQPYAIVAGNPAQEIRRRFSDEHCERLLATAWWDWPDDRVRAMVDLLTADDVEAFLRVAGQHGQCGEGQPA
jgi:acetyltransferase-like isoleucine patch superfamily enzyme